MYIHKDDTQNFPLYRLQFETFNTCLMNQQSKFIKVPKVFKPTNKKNYTKTLGTCVKKQPVRLLVTLSKHVNLVNTKKNKDNISMKTNLNKSDKRIYLEC